MNSFLAALEFLTRLRVRRTPRGDMNAVAAAQAWFPIVGLIIGLSLAGLDWIARRALPEASVDVLLVVALAAVTGGLHLDGLADAADGLIGGRDRDERLAIMHDVHAGSYAIIAIVSVLALKWAGLAAMPDGVRVETLILTPCLARFTMVLSAAAFPYARPEGVGLGFHEKAWPAATITAAAITTAAAVLLLGAGGLLAVLFAAACAWTIGSFARRTVGGMTGDLYGATIEIGEALLLLFIAALAQRDWISGWFLR